MRTPTDGNQTTTTATTTTTRRSGCGGHPAWFVGLGVLFALYYYLLLEPASSSPHSNKNAKHDQPVSCGAGDFWVNLAEGEPTRMTFASGCLVDKNCIKFVEDKNNGSPRNSSNLARRRGGGGEDDKKNDGSPQLRCFFQACVSGPAVVLDTTGSTSLNQLVVQSKTKDKIYSLDNDPANASAVIVEGDYVVWQKKKNRAVWPRSWRNTNGTGFQMCFVVTSFADPPG